LDLVPLRFDFVARDRLHFAAGKSANILRGAFGIALERISTPAEYRRLFEPRGGGPSGFADRPRPFVFRARHLDGATVEPGEPFRFGLNLFALDPEARRLVAEAFDYAAGQGIGPGRGLAELREVSGDPISLDLAADGNARPRIRVDFLTPTELKHEDRLVGRPEFGVLFARARDRVGTMRAFYGAGPLAIDFAGLGARAALARMTRCELREVAVARRSSRTGQTHGIGGFIGFAEYEGALGEFLPFLRAARWTGVGRQAVWGKGEVAVADLRD
jgi:hypothetical protein